MAVYTEKEILDKFDTSQEEEPASDNKDLVRKYVDDMRAKGALDQHVIAALVRIAAEALDHRDIWSAWAKDQYGLPLPWEKLKWERKYLREKEDE